MKFCIADRVGCERCTLKQRVCECVEEKKKKSINKRKCVFELDAQPVCVAHLSVHVTRAAKHELNESS